RHGVRGVCYGATARLLPEPRLQYVKGYYQRPIVQDGVMKEGGGGRVTELVARPLIHLFYPELSGLLQQVPGGSASCAAGPSRSPPSTRDDGRSSRRSRSSPATRSRSDTSSTPPSGSGSKAWARSTSSGGVTRTTTLRPRPGES